MKQRKGLTTHKLSERKKISSWATVGTATDKHQAPTHRWKLYVRAFIESGAWPTVVQLLMYSRVINDLEPVAPITVISLLLLFAYNCFNMSLKIL